MIDWFASKGIAALGIAAFGPTAVNPKSPEYGHILQTPKLAWRGYDFLGEMQRGLAVPCGYDTDVNGACLGEVMYGAGKGLDNVVYITVGTGIGAGVYVAVSCSMACCIPRLVTSRSLACPATRTLPVIARAMTAALRGSPRGLPWWLVTASSVRRRWPTTRLFGAGEHLYRPRYRDPTSIASRSASFARRRRPRPMPPSSCLASREGA